MFKKILIAHRGEINVHNSIVEKARSVTISCSWHQGDLKLKLIDPLGNKFDTTTRLSNYNVEFDVHRFPEGIIQADFDLSGSFPTGTWALQVTTEDKYEPGIGYTIEVYHRDPLLTPLYTTNKNVYKSDEQVIISAILQNGKVPITDAIVRAVIARENEIIDTLILRDDGLGNDSLADDGIYIEEFDVNNRQGDYYVHISAEKSGNSPFARHDDYAIMFIVNNSFIKGPAYEKTLDIDSNGFYDSLIVGFDFDLTNASDYQMQASLYDINDIKFAARRICDDFPKGLRTIEFSFDGSAIFEHGIDGPYYLKGLTLSDSCDNVPVLDSLENMHTTKPYDYLNFERSPIFITGNHKIIELDIDNDGLIDSLALIFEVEFKEQSRCLWTGFLKTVENHRTCSRAESKGTYEAGISEVRLSFSGEHLRLCPYDGIYSISVTVINRGSDCPSKANFSFKTREFKHTEFE